MSSSCPPERFHTFLEDEREAEVIKATQGALQLTPGYAQGRPPRLLATLGVDSKFFERHRGRLIQLPDLRFEGRVSDLDPEAFLGAPEEGDHWLLLVPLAPQLLPFTRQRVRASELHSTKLRGSHLLIVENEHCLHQLPPLPDTLAILGAGLHLEWMATPALREKRLAYWGDLDTWGLTILAKARTLQPHLTALMMDSHLFDTCRDSSVTETSPAPELPRERLTPCEQDFYRYLRGLAKGRVEQEFVPPQKVVATLEHWRGTR